MFWLNRSIQAINHLLCAVQDSTEVHRVVMPYRAWDLPGLVEKDQAHTLLRQSGFGALLRAGKSLVAEFRWLTGFAPKTF